MVPLFSGEQWDQLGLTRPPSRVPGRRYLQRLRAISVEEHLVRGHGQPCPHGVAEAVLLSLEAIRAGDRRGVYTGVIEIMAVLAATGVRRELLHAAGQAGVLARRRRRVSAQVVDRALAQLAERSLLTFTLDGQAVIAHSRQGRLAAVCRAAASVLDARVGALSGAHDRVAVWDMLEQVTALAENAVGSAAEADDELARTLLSPRFWALYDLNELDNSASQAIVVGEPLVADSERLLGLDHPDTLTARNNLAVAYQDAGRVAEAIPLFEQTLAALERLLGPDHPDALTTRNNLAVAYQEAASSGGRSRRTTNPTATLVDQVGSHIHNDRPELVGFVDLVQ